MNIYWLPIRLAGLFLLLAGRALLGALPVRAFEPGQDDWFIETITIGGVSLPAGLVIQSCQPADEPRTCLMIQNQTKTPLYVLSLSYKDVLVMPTPDPQWESRVRMAHEVASFHVIPGKPVYLGMEALTDLDHSLVDRNVLSSNPPPAGVTIPAAQASELLLVYAKQVILVPFTLTYAVNTHFTIDSEADQNWIATAQVADRASATVTPQAEVSIEREASNNHLALGLAVAFVLFITGLLIWVRFLRRR